MLNLFSAEPTLENNFSDEQVLTIIHALRREGKAEEIIYHTENKESFRYVITTKLTTDTDEKQIRTTTSVDKFKLQEDEFLEFIQDTLDGDLVREKQYTLPLQEDHDHQACLECLQPIAIKHLRCISKIEKILSSPRPRTVIKESGSRTTVFLFALLIALIGGSLYVLIPLFTNKPSADLTLLFNTVDVQVWLGAKKYPTKGNRVDLTLPLGRYRLLAKKAGFKPVRQDIFLTSNEEIGIRLEEIYTLTVYADMEGSRVMLDGNIVGTAGNTSPLEFSLTKGEYDLRLTNPSVSTPFQKKIQLNDDQIIRAELPHPRLTIRTNVDDVVIAVAKKEYQVQGKELALKLPIGTHQLIVRKPSYAPVEKEVIIENQDQTLPITLEMIHHQLSIIPNVANSSISVTCTNGQKYFGIASPDNPFQVETSAQSCSVLAENQGYQHIGQDVSLTGDQELPITLKQLFLVTVYTNMDLSTVLLDGKEAGRAGTRTPAVFSIPSGNYALTVSNPQAAAPIHQKLLLTKDQRLNIDLPLPQVTVKVNVQGATLIIDEKEHQLSGKQLTLGLPLGSHHITAQKKGHITIQREVLVRAGAQTFFELLPQVHSLSIRSNIDKTAIYVKCKDGKEHSGTASPKTPFHLEAIAGACTISASREGYKHLTKTVTLPDEKDISVELVAEEKEKILRPEKRTEPVKGLETVPEAKTEAISAPSPTVTPPVKPTPKPAPEPKPELKPKPDSLPVPIDNVAEEKEKILRPKKKKQRVKELKTGPRTKSEAKSAPKFVPKSTPTPAPASKTKPKPKPKPKPDPLQIKAEKKGCQNEISVGMPELCD
ncbi:MAG: PEGA domain-containing protein [Candidatus Electrothrix sp. Rat3]|nr:PEGA domain-containing protein [Candidatus Electrothrix rattekaaiensis]